MPGKVAPHAMMSAEEERMFDLDGWAHVSSGKVRDLYVPQDASAHGSGDVILVVATDRISAFDHVLPTRIPDKGKILAQLSLWWFEQLKDVVPNHLVSLDVPEPVRGRAMICRRLNMIHVECVARGYLAGSAMSEYRATGGICGITLPKGLREGDELPEPIFTPATKAEAGSHDENISFEELRTTVGAYAPQLRATTLKLYRRARRIASSRGLILADTKFEFGVVPESTSAHDIILADEVLTSDSSRYWDAADWEPGRPQYSFDKQFVRDWLLSPESGWNRLSDEPPPPLPDEIVEKTRARYLEAFRRLTGTEPEL
ncbi:MAG: phosphoribosylaminoimidazolesuccinocarboxamide synthase [Actinomycetales bacterium]|nr:phosphoribosylaminoimidazolesuccinocarboxamide synthase [Actinomycetales bacterium]